MKKTKVLYLVVVFALFVVSVVMFSGIAQAGAVPDGFMGIPWGASTDQIIKTMNERGYRQYTGTAPGKMEDSEGKYITKMIELKNVGGVKVRLSKLIFRDCNEVGIILKKTLVSGDGNGFHDKYRLDASMIATQKLCTVDKRVTETIFSEWIFIKSLTNGKVKGEVIVSFVIPKEFDLETVVLSDPFSLTDAEMRQPWCIVRK